MKAKAANAALADRNLRLANDERAARQLAEQQTTLNQRLRYIAEINAASRDYWAGNMALARKRLADLAPAADRDPDLRNFEWYYLSGLFSQEWQVLKNHEGAIRSLAFSPDGATIASCGDDNTVRLWDMAAGRELAVLRGHAAAVVTVSFSPDGRRLMSASGDKIVRIWDVDAGRELRQLSGAHDSPQCVAFSADWKYLATAGQENTIRVLDAESCEERSVLRGAPSIGFGSVASFSGNGERIVHANCFGALHAWEVSSGRLLWTGSFANQGPGLSAKGDSDVRVSLPSSPWFIEEMTGARFSPDGTRVALPTWDNVIHVVDAQTGQERLILIGHSDTPACVAFSPDGKQIASGGGDNTVRVWDAETGTTLAVLRGHESRIFAVAYSPDGRWIASAGEDAVIRLWDVEATLLKSRAVADGVGLFAFADDGVKMAPRYPDSDGLTSVCNVETGRSFPALKKNLEARAFSADGRTIAAKGDDNSISLWDAATGRIIANLGGIEHEPQSAIFSPDGNKVLVIAEDKSVSVWNPRDGVCVAKLSGHEDSVTAAAFSADGACIATGSKDKTVRLWDSATGRQLVVFRGHESPVVKVMVASDCRRVASLDTGNSQSDEAIKEQSLRIWNVDDDRRVSTYPVIADSRFALSPDFKRMLAANRLYDVTSGRAIIELGYPRMVLFSPDGKRFIAGWDDGTVRIYDAETARELLNFLEPADVGHLPNIMSLDWSRDGRRIAASNLARMCWVWSGGPDVEEHRLRRQAMGLVQFHLRRAESEHDFLERIRGDRLAEVNIRAIAESLATGIWNGQNENQADGTPSLGE